MHRPNLKLVKRIKPYRVKICGWMVGLRTVFRFTCTSKWWIDHGIRFRLVIVKGNGAHAVDARHCSCCVDTTI